MTVKLSKKAATLLKRVAAAQDGATRQTRANAVALAELSAAGYVVIIPVSTGGAYAWITSDGDDVATESEV